MKKTRLGRGLGELLGEIDTAYENENNSSTHKIEEIDVELIIPNPNQPRKNFDPSQIAELSASIKQHGLLQPINITRDGDKFVLIAGERRLKATKQAGFKTINAIIINIADNKLSELALIENIQREDLNIMELANSYNQLINEHGLTHEDLSKKVSKSRSSITNTLRLLNLSQFAQNKLSDNDITLGHAKVMIGLDEKQQKQIIDSIIGQKLNVRDTENIIKNIKSKTNIKTDKSLKIKENMYNINKKPLEEIVNTLENNDIKVTLKNDYLKLHFTSSNDVKKICEYLFKSN